MMTTAFANAFGTSKCGDARSARLPTQRDAGQAIAASANATAPISRPDITAPATRNAFRLAVVTPLGRSPSRTCRSPSRLIAYAGWTPRACRDQKLLSTKRKAGLPPIQARTASIERNTTGQTPLKNADSWVETLPNQ